MNEDRIKTLLTETDATAGSPKCGPVSAAGIRDRVGRRRIKVVVFPIAAAAMLLLGVGLWSVANRTQKPPSQDADKVAKLEEQVRQLQLQSAETLRLVREVIAAERQQSRIEALETELAGIRDPVEQMRQQEDEAAYMLVYQANRFYRELNQPQSAIETYEQVIRVFPDSPWAEEARDRLAEIRTHRTNRT